jgi:tetratricopeptide (TPR) repeat protein
MDSIITARGTPSTQQRVNPFFHANYCPPVVNYDDPRSTAPEIWATLGESQVENGSYESGIVALDHQLAAEERPAAKVKAHLLEGRAYVALGKMEEATTSAEAGLDIDKETLSAQLRLILGNVAMAAKRFTEAIGSYGLGVGNWEDATVTPLAMTKLIQAYEATGTPENTAKAAAVRAELNNASPASRSSKGSRPPASLVATVSPCGRRQNRYWSKLE